MTARTDQRREYLLDYLHLTIEDLAHSGKVHRKMPIGTALSVIGRQLLSDFGRDSAAAWERYLREKGGEATRRVAPLAGMLVGGGEFGEAASAMLRGLARVINPRGGA